MASMEKILQFKGQGIPNQTGKLKQVKDKAGFYSEEETEETKAQKLTQKVPINSKFADQQQKIKQENANSYGYATEEEDEENPKKAAMNGPIIPKKSKFQGSQGDTTAAETEDAQKEESKEPAQQSQQQKKPITSQKVTMQPLSSLTQKPKDLKARFMATHTTVTGVDSDAEAKKIKKTEEVWDTFKNHPYRHLIFSSRVSETIFRKHLVLTYRGLVYAKKCLKGPSEKFIKSKQVQLPEAKIPKGNTLLMDLDETLIHSVSLKDNPDHIVKAKGDFGDESKIGIRIRPYCMEFLQKMTQFWDIYVYTAASPAYATAIINFLDPENKYINGILNRTNCMETKNGFFIKDMRILKGKDLKKMVLVDNLAHSFGFQIENGIPILEWHDDKYDTELKHLMAYLTEAAQVEDVRVFNKERLKLDELAEMRFEDL